MSDLSQFSTDDLMAMKNGNIQSMSTAGLEALRGMHNETVAPQDAAPPPQSGGFLSGLKDTLAHVPAGLLTAARDTAQGIGSIASHAMPLPPGANLSNLAEAATNASPKLKDTIDTAKNYDFYKAAGLNENLLDKLGVGALEYALPMKNASKAVDLAKAGIEKLPQAAEKLSQFAQRNPATAKLGRDAAENAAAGGMFNALYAPEGEKGSETAKGAALGAATALPAFALNPLVKYGAERYAQSAIPKFTKAATDKIRELLPLDDYAKTLTNKFLGAYSKNKENWTKATQAAADLDSAITKPMRVDAPLVKIKEKNSYPHEIENTDTLGGARTPTFIGKDYEKVPNPIKKEIVGYDPSGSPIMQETPYDFGVAKKEPPLTVKGPREASQYHMVEKADPAGSANYEIGKDFENSPYLDYINKFHGKMRNLEPSERVPYSQASEVAKAAADLAPKSFKGAMAARQNINEAVKNYLNQDGKVINPANRQTKQFLTGLKKNLVNDTLKANESKVGKEALNDFKSKWEEANQSHQDLQEFYKGIQPATGVMKPLRQMRERYAGITPESGRQLDDSVIAKYAPSLTPTGAKGVEGIKHLEKLMGDKKAARDAVKAYLFNKQIDNGAGTVDAAARYAAMSKSQQKRLFGNSPEGRYLQAINDTRIALGREPEKTSKGIGWGHHLIGATVPGLAVTGAGLASGEGWEKAAGQGFMTALAVKGLEHGAAKFATPESVARAVRIAKSNGPLTGSYLNAILQTANNPAHRGYP